MNETNPNSTTILPDGSAFFTASIMSKEEALKLPLKERPLCFRVSSEIYHAVFEHVGMASLCWEPKPTGVFDSTKASDVAVKLCFLIAEDNEKRDDLIMKTKKQTTKLSNAIQQEINWSKKHKSQNPNGRDWFLGFIDGLTLAKNIIVKSERISD